MPDPRSEKDALVVGGGLAGITAALELADAGWSVTLAEARPRLGGAAFSFARGPLTIDNGQHIFLRCCTAYRGLLDRLGANELVSLQPRLSLEIVNPDGRRAWLSRTPGLPSPLHLGASLARFRLLSAADRLRAVRGALALRALDPADPALDQQTLGAFLRAHHQNDQTIAALWGVLVTATLNIDVDAASLQLGAKVFRTGLLDEADAADIGHATVPLGDIHHTAALRAMQAAGVDVRLSTKLEELAFENPTARSSPIARLRGRDQSETLSPGAIVLAVPHQRVAAVAGELSSDLPLATMAKLGASPIINVHVIYDRPVTDASFAAGDNSDVQWVFDRTDSSGLRRDRPGAQYLAVTVSAADGLIDTPSAEVTDRFIRALGELFPRARHAQVLEAFVTREREATFRQQAGSVAARPGPATASRDVALAGAWTDTGWPDTMESAVRSGSAAARLLLASRAEVVSTAA
jgi:squalene-associated FAD-dependent desaturase